MRKMMGLSLAIMLCVPSINSQRGNSGGGQGKQDPSVRIERTIKDLNLNEKQAAKFRKTEKKYNGKFEKERAKFEKKQNAFRNKAEDLRSRREANLKKIMTNEQFARYQQMQEKRYSEFNRKQNERRNSSYGEMKKGRKDGVHGERQRPNRQAGAPVSKP